MSVTSDREVTPVVVESQPSGFSYRDLAYLNDEADSYRSPLAVICHIDMNAFYAQVEQVRLNLTKDDPVVFVQWQAVIAVSYAARKFGINRMDTVQTCKQKCPEVILAHAAVYEKGNSHWNYLNKVPFQGYCKVSLDPYRRESRKIFKVMKLNCDLIEKASVDEGYLDMGRVVYKKLIANFPYLDKPIDGTLPPIPQELPESFKFEGRVYTEGQDSIVVRDWDDIIAILGSQAMFDIRRQIYDELGYTTSGGLGRNKMLAKLSGGFLKPDNQVIILNSRVDEFLKNFELIDIGGMGGKVGEMVLSRFSVPGDVNSIKYLRDNFSKKDLVDEPEIPNHLYDLIRGNHASELRSRTDIKSMMSRKQFLSKHPITSLYDVIDWLKVFAGDLRNRLQDLDDENSYQSRPKTISVNLIMGSKNVSKQSPFPVINDLEKLQETINKMALKLVIELLEAHYDMEKLNSNRKPDYGHINPMNKVNIPSINNMAVIITKLFRVAENSMGTVAQKSDQIRKMFDDFNKQQLNEEVRRASESPKKPKKRKMDREYIDKMFAQFDGDRKRAPKPVAVERKPAPTKPSYNILERLSTKPGTPQNWCSKCNTTVADPAEHSDYHMALELSKQLNGQ